MKGEIEALQGSNLEGFVKIELIRKDGVKIKEQHNTITPAGKALFLEQGASKLLDMNGIVFGTTVKQGAGFNSKYISSNVRNASNYENCLTNTVLNLSDSQLENMTTSTNFINLLGDDMGTASKVLGYANININPVKNGKEGTIDYPKGTEALKGEYITRKFKYADGVATGTINAIAMAPMSALTNAYGKVNTNGDMYAPGFTISKCLDRVNIQDANFVSQSDSFLPPGVLGFTSDTEIIMNYSQDGSSMHKINTVTGEITDIELEENFLTLKDACSYYGTNIIDYIVDGSFLYVLTRSGDAVIVNIYDLISKSKISGFNADGSRYLALAKLLKLGEELYITYMYCNNNSEQIRMSKLSKGSNSYFSSVAETGQDYTSILTMPSSLEQSYICFGNYGTNYVLYISRNYGVNSSYSSSNTYFTSAYIFSDLENIGSSIIDCIPSVHIGEILFKNASLGGVLSIGKCHFSNYYDDYETKKSVTSNDKTTNISLMDKGLFFTPDNMWSNIVSVVKLSEPLTKGTSDVLLITYGYKIK